MLLVAGDWLQGPATYPMYRSHGLDKSTIGVLFVVGFLSGAASGPFVGTLVDKFGRKRGAIMLCVTYSLCSILIQYDSMPILMVGRFFGGVSTSLLHTAFEAWLTYEHFHRGFPAPALSTTFALSTLGNSIVAIVMGLVSDFVTNWRGDPDSLEPGAPFMVAVIAFGLCAAVVWSSWSENYGSGGGGVAQGGAQTSSVQKFQEALKTIATDKAILATGLIQVLFETCMYVFVFLWSPVLEDLVTDVPYGLVFACFMVAIMIGSVLFRWMLDRGWTGKDMAKLQMTLSSVSMVALVVSKNLYVVYTAFILFEMCCGIHFPLAGTLRSKYVPEDSRATIMSTETEPAPGEDELGMPVKESAGLVVEVKTDGT
ncbi:hypothetical protein HDU93_005280 [Gonapodya sp. JEL0774]|nr:hypothetical protein HDU93_005280 [Gonapodya sp. JEL0774]